MLTAKSSFLGQFNVIIQSNAHCEGELFETIKSNDSGAFAKYAVENYAVEAFIGKSKVESDKILLNCKVRDAIATFGRYVKFVMNPNRDDDSTDLQKKPETESSTSNRNAFEILLNSSRKISLPEPLEVDQQKSKQ